MYDYDSYDTIDLDRFSTSSSSKFVFMKPTNGDSQ